MKKREVLVRHPLDRPHFKTVMEGESMTHQAHAASCDINNIIKRFDRTGQLPPGREDAQYADVTGLQDGDLTERINKSREVLDAAGRAVEEKRLAEAKALADQQARDKADLERLRAMEKEKQTQDSPGS